MLFLALEPLTDKGGIGWEGVVGGRKETRSASSQKRRLCLFHRSQSNLPTLAAVLPLQGSWGQEIFSALQNTLSLYTH